MYHNLFTALIGETKEDFLNKLQIMHAKNPNLIRLIRLFNLEWACPPLEEYMNTEQIINHLQTNKLKIKIMSTNKKTNSKFKNEIEVNMDKAPFFKFENEGDSCEGRFLGHELIDFQDGKGARKIFAVEINGEKYNMPTNAELNKKLEMVESQGVPNVEIYIEFVKITKLQGGKSVKNFKVLTA